MPRTTPGMTIHNPKKEKHETMPSCKLTKCDYGGNVTCIPYQEDTAFKVGETVECIDFDHAYNEHGKWAKGHWERGVITSIFSNGNLRINNTPHQYNPACFKKVEKEKPVKKWKLLKDYQFLDTHNRITVLPAGNVWHSMEDGNYHASVGSSSIFLITGAVVENNPDFFTPVEGERPHKNISRRNTNVTEQTTTCTQTEEAKTAISLTEDAVVIGRAEAHKCTPRTQDYKRKKFWFVTRRIIRCRACGKKTVRFSVEWVVGGGR